MSESTSMACSSSGVTDCSTPATASCKRSREPRLRSALERRQRAAASGQRIEATVVRRAPQVMVKVTGGGRGMKAIAAHFRYISKNGRLEIEDDRGQTVRGKDAIRELADDWRFGGSLIEDVSARREAFNIMLSMPRGSADALIVQRAAREFAQTELADHKYVMVLHDHQANPHVHISVRAESKRGKRLNPAQGRPASLARDIRREAAGLGHRCGSDPAGHSRCHSKPTTRSGAPKPGRPTVSGASVPG